MQRYFATKKNDNKFELLDSDMKHIRKVMRMNVNDEIIVVFNNTSYLCYLDNNYVINIKEQLEDSEETIPYVCLIVPILKEQKMDYILQKSTELGVSEIMPFYSERGVVKETDKKDKKIDRWKMILKEASEQSHRNTIPKLEKIINLNEINLDGINIVCSTVEKSTNIKNTLKSNKNCDRINVVIGPEGGLSKKEEQNLIINNFKPVTFGNRILRVETAPLFIMSIVNYEYME